MKKNSLAPFFESISTVRGKLDYINFLCTIDTEARWCELLGYESFDKFTPPGCD